MKVAVDTDLCIGSGMCALTAPRVFDQDPGEGVAPAEAGPDPVLPGDADDPGRPEDLTHEPGAPHLALDEDQER